MSGSKPSLTDLQTRKQLLLLESDLNRAQMRSDYAALHQEAAGFWRAGETLITSVSFLYAGIKAIRRFRSENSGGGILPTLFKLVNLGISFWRGRRGREE
jgi:hypothetical protein